MIILKGITNYPVPYCDGQAGNKSGASETHRQGKSGGAAVGVGDGKQGEVFVLQAEQAAFGGEEPVGGPGGEQDGGRDQLLPGEPFRVRPQ